jgi:drug/metabolite transporter (DMT)-like permease
VNPTIASLTMSLESVFAVLAGWAILGEQLSTRELIGCAIMMAAIIAAQIKTK